MRILLAILALGSFFPACGGGVGVEPPAPLCSYWACAPTGGCRQVPVPCPDAGAPDAGSPGA